MHIPRHSLSSHFAAPAFISAHFGAFEPADLHSSPGELAGSSQRGSDANKLISVSPDKSDLKLEQNDSLLSCATRSGFLVAQTYPLRILTRRDFPGTYTGLSHVATVDGGSLLILVGGGRYPRYEKNKVILWDEAATSVPVNSFTHRNTDPASLSTDHASTIFSAGSQLSHQSKEIPNFERAYNRKENLAVKHRIKEWRRDARTFAIDFENKGSSANNDDDTVSVENNLEHLGSEESETAPISRTNEKDSNLSHGTDFDDIRVGPKDRILSEMDASSGVHSALSSSHLYTKDSSYPQSYHHTSSESPSLPNSASLFTSSLHHSSANLCNPFDSVPQHSQQNKLSPSVTPIDRTTPISHSSEQILDTGGGMSISFSKDALFEKDMLRDKDKFESDSSQNACHTSSDATISELSSTDNTKPNTSKVNDHGSDGGLNSDNQDNKNDAPTTTGREVAELVFSEPVQGVCVKTFYLVQPDLNHHSSRKSSGSQQTSSTTVPQAEYYQVTLMVVLLSCRAIVFELTPHSENHQQQVPMTNTEQHREHKLTQNQPLTIHQRMVINTVDNPHGLAEMSRLPGHSTALLVLPGRQRGHVQMVCIPLRKPSHSSDARNTPVLGATTIITAHEAPLDIVSLSSTGLLLATASERGTLVRIWAISSSHGGQGPRGSISTILVRELRRGTDPARIFSIAFTPDDAYVAAASEKGTIHFWSLDLDPSLFNAFQLNHVSKGQHTGHSRMDDRENTTFDPKHIPDASSSPWSNAAQKYLPRRLGTLVAQLPPSLLPLPQYFRSQWSEAQFRISLNTFSSAPSDHIAPSTPVDSNTSSNTRPRHKPDVTGPGITKNTEGAWAALKGRIEDILKWEPGLDEQIYLKWVGAPLEEDAMPSFSPISDSYSSTNSTKSKHDEQWRKQQHQYKHEQQLKHQLVAITTSGRWFRISLDRCRETESLPMDSSACTKSADESDHSNREDVSDSEREDLHDTVLNMYRENDSQRYSSMKEKQSNTRSHRFLTNTKGCTLREFHRFGARDTWSDDF